MQPSTYIRIKHDVPSNNRHTFLPAQHINTVHRDRPPDRPKRQKLVDLDQKPSDLSGFESIQSPKKSLGILYVF